MAQKIRKFMGMFFVTLGAICFFMAYIFQRYPNTYWGYFCAAGIGFALLGVLHTISSERHLPKALLIVIHALAGVCFAIFLTVEGLILSSAGKQETNVPDVVIVLGAGLNDDQISLALKGRLDSAIALVQTLPESVPVVVTGGQGKNETISEAEAMAKYLMEQGIEPERILQENRATSTHENMHFTRMLLQERGMEQSSATIVTNGFHLFRSTMLARRAGFTEVYAYSADMPGYLKPTYYLREFFAFLKSFLVDR